MQNYNKLWEGCKSEKAKREKLLEDLELLRERGLDGKPSISKCRILKEKYERRKEVTELSTSNIIQSSGIRFLF